MVLVESALARGALAAGAQRRPEFATAWESRRRALLIAELEREFTPEGEPTATAIAAFYEALPDRFRLATRIATRFILLKLPVDAEAAEVAEASAKLEQIRSSFLAAGGFGELARRYSEAENAVRGGAVAAATRGSLLEEYEEAAWKLASGEVSRPVRLPGGMAIIWLEQTFPARELSLDEASKSIVKQLQARQRAQRREAALAEARAAWPLTIDWPDGPAGGPGIVLAGESLTLEDLGLEHRPPRLDEEIARRVESLWLGRLAERRRIAESPEMAQRLEDLKLRMLAGTAVEEGARELLPVLDETALRRLYDKRAERLAVPETRVFEVLRIVGREGTMRVAQARASEAASVWRRTSVMPADSDSPTSAAPARFVEIWGPLSRSVLGNKISPLLAKAAFELGEGEVSEPIRFERYEKRGGRFSPEGYVVLRLVSSSPRTVPPFTAVRDELQDLDAELPRLRALVREQAQERLALDVSPAELAACVVDEPPPAATPGQGPRAEAKG